METPEVRERVEAKKTTHHIPHLPISKAMYLTYGRIYGLNSPTYPTLSQQKKEILSEREREN